VWIFKICAPFIFRFFLADNQIKKGLNASGQFSGTIQNRQNIGLTSNDLVSQWNENYPDDLVAS